MSCKNFGNSRSRILRESGHLPKTDGCRDVWMLHEYDGYVSRSGAADIAVKWSRYASSYECQIVFSYYWHRWLYFFNIQTYSKKQIKFKIICMCSICGEKPTFFRLVASMHVIEWVSFLSTFSHFLASSFDILSLLFYHLKSMRFELIQSINAHHHNIQHSSL